MHGGGQAQQFAAHGFIGGVCGVVGQAQQEQEHFGGLAGHA